MALPTAFRLSFFVTLALACTCLTIAETFFLHWMSYFLIGAFAFLIAAYYGEGRWVLSADGANRLGMVIAIAAAFWILYNLPRSEEDLIAGGVPWPAGLLPHLGPVLIVLLLVKLFRPKRLADFWAIQTIGLMMVTLACVLAAESLFGLVLIVYFAALLWTLALFYLIRQEALSRGPDHENRTLFGALDGQPPLPLPWTRLGLGRVLRWTAGVVVFGLVLFFIAPRQPNMQWAPKLLTNAIKATARTGVDEGMDLNRMGKIELSDEPAFEVQAMDVNGPKTDLDAETRWFVQTLDYYARGRWLNWTHGATPPNLTWGLSPKPDPLARPSEEGIFPPHQPPKDMKGPPAFYLYFRVRIQAAGGLVLAEPMQGSRLGLYPHLSDYPMEASLFFHQIGTDTILSGPLGRRRTYQYGQVVPKPATEDLVPAKEIHPRYPQFLTSQDVPESITEWVRGLLGTLPDLKEDERRLDEKGHVPLAAQQKVARALSRYLTQSGHFGYSLELRRRQMSIDPLADFLLNVKEGHCERFAGGLTLMLRSVGIPARIIRGYRGHEPFFDPGQYLVRQNQAHSWVQALVEQGRTDQGPSYAWLTLDPTPSSELAERSFLGWFRWIFERWTDGDQVWRAYVLDFNADSQRRTFDLLRERYLPESPRAALRSIALLAVALGGAYVALALWRRWSRKRARAGNEAGLSLAATGTGFYAVFLQVMERRLNLRPQPGQTPQEFGLVVRGQLEQLALAPLSVMIPQELITLLYQARFGGHVLSPEQQEEAGRRTTELEAELQKALAAN